MLTQSCAFDSGGGDPANQAHVEPRASWARLGAGQGAQGRVERGGEEVRGPGGADMLAPYVDASLYVARGGGQHNVTGPQDPADGDAQQAAASHVSDQGWGGVGGWANAQGLQLQQLQQGLQHGLQQLQQSVVIGAKKDRSNGSNDPSARVETSAGEDEEDGAGAAAAEAARRRAEDAEAAAMQLRLERVDKIAKGYLPVKDLTEADKRLLWRYRKRLPRFSRGLLPLFHATRWDVEAHVRQVLELVPTWVDLETEDALELLGSNYSVVPIRNLAIRSLEKISDAELLCFLMPLSVALRYDVVDDSPSVAAVAAAAAGGQRPGGTTSSADPNGSGADDLLSSLLSPSRTSQSEGNEGTAAAADGGASKTHAASHHTSEGAQVGARRGQDEDETEGVGSLASFLIARSCKNARLATALFWHLSVERSCGGEHSRLYKRAHLLLCQRLQSERVSCHQGLAGEAGDTSINKPSSLKGGSAGGSAGEGTGVPEEGGKRLLIHVLRRQEHFVASLGGLVAELKKGSKLPRPQQVATDKFFVCACRTVL